MKNHDTLTLVENGHGNHYVWFEIDKLPYSIVQFFFSEIGVFRKKFEFMKQKYVWRDFIFDNFWFWTKSNQQSNIHLGLFLFEIRLLLDFWTSGCFLLIVSCIFRPVIYCLVFWFGKFCCCRYYMIQSRSNIGIT